MSGSQALERRHGRVKVSWGYLSCKGNISLQESCRDGEEPHAQPETTCQWAGTSALLQTHFKSTAGLVPEHPTPCRTELALHLKKHSALWELLETATGNPGDSLTGTTQQ